MLRLVLRRARLRFAIGLAVAAALPMLLPDARDVRLWMLAAGATAAPWLVLGRDATRAREGWRVAASSARGHLVVLLELVPALLVVSVAAFVGAGGWRPGLALFVWGAALVTLADAADRRWSRSGPAWVGLLVLVAAVWTAPLWLAPWYGRPGLSPWLVSVVVALHPVGSVLASAKLPTLQDPTFYTLTLSGVVEARPLSWIWGVSLHALVATAGAALAVRAARRPGRCPI